MRIAHLSDFHMRDRLPGTLSNPLVRNREMPALLEPLMARLRTLQPDLLVASGDLIDYPPDRLDDPETQAQALADLRQLRTLLSEAGCSLAVVPGNHDHPRIFDQVFGDLSQDFVCAGHRVLTFYDAEDAGHVPHRHDAERRRFEQALTAAQTTSLPQIHIQHFLIWPLLHEEYPYNYPDCASMLDAMAESGRVRLCLTGHYHAGIEPSPVRNITFAGVPAFCEPPHPLWLYELTDRDITCTVYTPTAPAL